ncbi:hypothetical protein V8F20_006593 [Naviculisporaceae sp. PSN 640]
MSQQWQNGEQQQFLDAQFFNQQIPDDQLNTAVSSDTWWLSQDYGPNTFPLSAQVPPAPHTVPSQAPGHTTYSLSHRVLHSVAFFKHRRDEACWRCRNSHTKCEPRTRNPCDRCAAQLGNVKIACLRGDVCILRSEVPFLCHLQTGADGLELLQLPTGLQPGASFLSRTKQRRNHDWERMKDIEMRDPGRPLFWSVVNTTVPNINRFSPGGFEDMGLTYTKVTYDVLIMSIVWELENNPRAAHLMGIGSVAHLVAFLEAACLCESRFGHYEPTNRLVYAAMRLVLYCLEALRLLDNNLLAANTHAYCTEANKCICPAFHGITKYGERYADLLTKALFSKKRDGTNIWTLVFYSLCLQAHVRRALMALEGGLVDLGRQAVSDRTHTYLHNAITLFEQISLQKDRKLAIKVCTALAQVQPSIYLREANARDIEIGWENWRNEQHNMPRYLRSIFTVQHPQHIHPVARGPPPDYGFDIPLVPQPPDSWTPANIVGTGTVSDVNMTGGQPVPATAMSMMSAEGPGQAPVATATTMTVGAGFRGVRGIPDARRDDDIASFYTETSRAANSDRWTVDTMSLAESVASTATYVPSLPPLSMGSSSLHFPTGDDADLGYGDGGAFDPGASWDRGY